MTPDSRSPSAEEFLSEDRWLRSLVRSLTREENVEDVVQNTWVVALSQLSSAHAPRAWLRTIARNFVWREFRARERRDEREELASRPEAVPSTEETLAWIELQREVARAVQELNEPYRTAILLRYTHACTTEQIAERTQVSEENVRQRLKRGRDQLRRTLAGSLGSEDSCGSPLALWWLPGVVEMKMRLSAVAVLMFVILTPVVWIAVSRVGAPSDGAEALTSLQNATPLVEPPIVNPLASSTIHTREEIGVVEALKSADNNPAAFPVLEPVRGRVVDPRGVGLAGIGIGKTAMISPTVTAEDFARPDVETRSARDGEFELNTDSFNFVLMSEAGWIPIGSSYVEEELESRTGVLVVLTRAVTRTGTVLDEDGRELEDVRVSLEGPHLRDFPFVTDRLRVPRWEPTHTDALGGFFLRELPAECGSLLIEKEGFESSRIAIDGASDGHLEVVLTKAKDVLVLHGHVLTPSGLAVCSALVGIGEHSTRSGAGGEYRLEVPRESITISNEFVFAAAHPWQTKQDKTAFTHLKESDSGQLAFDIRFEAEALAIGGRVVDAQGAPVAGLLVYLWHENVLSQESSAEDLAQAPDAPSLDVGPGVRVWDKTDEKGSFQLKGLSQRAYKLRFYDRERGAAFTVENVMAGTEGNLFTLPEDFLLREFSGRIVDREGRGLAGLMVGVHLGEYLSSRAYHTTSTNEMATTGSDGHFALHNVAGIDSTLMVNGEGFVSVTVPLKVAQSGELVIRVLRRCHFRLVIDDESLGAVGFRVLDAKDKPIMIDEIGAGVHRASDWGQLHEGRTQVLSVAEDAKTLVLFAADGGPWREVARRELSLATEGVTELRF